MSKSNKNQDLYISIDLPDNRKRFIITYENLTLTFLIDNKLSFQGFISIIIQRFKIDTLQRSSIRIKTDDGRRLTSLQNTFNNQILEVFLSTIKYNEQDDEGPTYSLRHSSNNNEELPSEKNNKDSNYFSDCLFLKHCRELESIVGKSNVIIGESYPYRVSILFANHNCKHSFSLYILDGGKDYSTTGLRHEDVIFHSDSTTLYDIINIEINHHLKENQSTICFMTFLVNSLLSTFNSFISTNLLSIPILQSDLKLIFPTNFDVLPTITSSSFLIQLNELIEKVIEIYKVPTSVAINFLFKYKWNLPFLRKSITKIDSYGTMKLEQHRFLNHINQELECSICYCEIDDPIEFYCGHVFCKGCVSGYLVASINDGNGNASPIRCPSVFCPVMIDSVTIATLVPERTANHLARLYLNDVAVATRSKWCPNNNCGRLIYTKQSKDYIPYSPCLCNNLLCIHCGKKEIHWPSPCQNSIFEDEELSSYIWMAENTTLCISCKFPVERNQGCNHMTCTQCRAQFCYICSSKWESSHYNCKRNFKKIINFTNQLTNIPNSPDSNLLSDILSKKKKSDKIAIIYSNFAFHFRSSKNKLLKKIIEDLLFYLSESIRKDITESDKALIYSSTRNNIQKVYKILKAGETKRQQQNEKPEYSRVRSLCCFVYLNGSSVDQVGMFFVPSQFSKLRESILDRLKDNPTFKDIGSSQLILYNQYKGQIRHSEEIMYNEVLFVAIENQPFIVPNEIPTPHLNQNNNSITFNKKEKVANNKKEIIKSPTIPKLSEEQIQSVSNRLSEMLNITIDECYDMVLKSGSRTEDEAINIVLTYQINKDKKFDNESQVLTRIQLEDLFPSLTEDIINRAILESKDDLEAAADWLYNYEDKFKNNNNNDEYYDEEDDYSDDDDEDLDFNYANSKLSKNQSRYFD